MSNKLLYSILLLLALVFLHQPTESKKLVIHVPYRVKTVKHTHTVYKIMKHHGHNHHHKGKRHDEYENEDDYYDYDDRKR